MLLLVSLSKVELLLINAHFSYMYVCCKWNVLPPELRTNHISLASFKCLLLQYYNEALHLYDADDIRTWRTICPRSEVQYSEDSPALALLLYFLPSLYFYPVYLLVALVVSYTFHIIIIITIIIIIIFNVVIG